MTTPHTERPAASRRARHIILAALVLGVLFEVLNILVTQVRPVRLASPWQDDPFDAIIGAGMFVVAMLEVVLGARLLAWRAPGAPDRARQMLRVTGTITAVIAITAGVQWAGVAEGAHGRAWSGWTTLLIAWLAVTTAATVGLSVSLASVRARRRGPPRWEHDWLGDAALLAARFPALGGLVTPGVVSWIRRRTITLFAALSAFAAVIVIGALAVGEHWTDTLLIGWALAVETAANFAFCMVTNALAGFIARPPRHPGRRIAETTIVAACLAIQVSEAFHDQIWQTLAGHPVDAVGELIALSGGAALIASAICAAAILIRRGPPGPRGRGVAPH